MRSGLANTTAWAAFIVFGAVLLPSLILGPSFQRNVSTAQRLANGLQFVPVYLLAFITFFASFERSFAGLYRHKTLLAWGTYGLISLFWAVDPQATLLEVLSLFGTILAVIAVTENVSFERFMRMLSNVLLVAAIGSIAFVYLLPSWGLMSGDDTMEFSTLMGVPQGVFRHKQQLAEVMSLGIIVPLASAGIVSNSRRFILFVTSVFCLVLSQSATGMMATLVGLGSVAIWYISSLATRSSIGSGAMMLILLLYGALILTFGLEYVLGAFGKDVTLTGRTEVWQHAIYLIQESPVFGYGFGSIWQTPMGVLPGSHIVIAHSHNTWLELMLMGGVIGTIPIVIFFVYALFVAVSGFNGNINNRVLLICMIFISLFRSMSEVDFHGNDISFYLLISSLIYFRKGQKSPPLKPVFDLSRAVSDQSGSYPHELK